MKSAQGDKRGLERFELEIPARIRISASGVKKEDLDLNTSDISSGGAFFHTSQPLEEGTDVHIDLILPIDGLLKHLEKAHVDSGKTLIKISGKVLRSEPEGMAIGFNKGYKISPMQANYSFGH